MWVVSWTGQWGWLPGSLSIDAETKKHGSKTNNKKEHAYVRERALKFLLRETGTTVRKSCAHTRKRTTKSQGMCCHWSRFFLRVSMSLRSPSSGPAVGASVHSLSEHFVIENLLRNHRNAVDFGILALEFAHKRNFCCRSLVIWY